MNESVVFTSDRAAMHDCVITTSPKSKKFIFEVKVPRTFLALVVKRCGGKQMLE